MATALCLCQSCDVLDIDPTGNYSETTAFNSIKNLDLYVKGFYSIFYVNSQLYVDASCLMDDGASDLIKYSWYGVDGGKMNRFFYQSNFVTPQGNFRSNWNDMYTRIRQLNEYFYDLKKYGNGLNPEEVAARTAEVRFMRAFAYQELVIRHGGVILRTSEEYIDGPEERAKARSSETECWDFILEEYKKAANDLPESWANSDAGRLTKGAAYGMQARAALYAKRWDKAIEACEEVLKLDYTLLPGTSYESYYKIFTSVNNKELILPVYYEKGQNKKQHNFVRHLTLSHGRVELITELQLLLQMNMHHLLTLKLMVCIKLLTGISLTFMETNLLIIASLAFTLLFYITGLHGKDALYSYMLTVMTDIWTSPQLDKTMFIDQLRAISFANS